MEYPFNTILLGSDCHYDGSNPKVYYRIESDGSIYIHRPKKGDPFDFKHSKNTKLGVLERGDLLFLFEAGNQFVGLRKPQYPEEDDTDIHQAIYLFNDGESLLVDENNRPLPVKVSAVRSVLYRGEFISRYYPKEPGQVIKKPNFFGSDVLSVLFDTVIPYGYELQAISNVQEIASFEKGRYKEEAQAFVSWLFDGIPGLPPISNEFRTFLDERQFMFHVNMIQTIRNLGREAMIADSLKVLAHVSFEGDIDILGYYCYLADELHSGQAASIAGGFLKQDENDSKALKYLLQGMESGIASCAYDIAEILAERGDSHLSDVYLKKAIDMGSADACATYASHLLSGLKDGDDCGEAMDYAKLGMYRGSSAAMVTLAMILWSYYKPNVAEDVEQLLLRAESLGQIASYVPLAHLYREGFGCVPKNLVLAETYIKKAILDEGGEPREMQRLYAQILLDQGKRSEAIEMLKDLVKDGDNIAKSMLGEIVCPTEGHSGILDCFHPLERELLCRSEKFRNALIWRIYPDVVPVEEARKALQELVDEGEEFVTGELARTYEPKNDEGDPEKYKTLLERYWKYLSEHTKKEGE